MGDRSYVTLSVLTSQITEALSLIDDGFEDQGTWADSSLTYLTYSEVNYGNLHCLHKLREHGIAYESEWEAGNEYGKGAEHLRFTPEGEAVVKTIYESEGNPNLGSLLAVIDDYEKLKKCILDHEKSITTLPWDNQKEYGKIYRATQLISP